MLAFGNVPGKGNPMNIHQIYQQANAQLQPIINNPVVPYPMLQPTLGQPVPTNCHCTNATPHDTNNT
jgi:hypothetical protein